MKRLFSTLVIILAIGLLVYAVFGDVGDGTVVATVKVQDNGPDNLKYNIVIMGDGYQNAELPTYRNQVTTFINAFNTAFGYGPCNNSVNFYRVDISSTDSGVDKPSPCYTPAINRATYLDTKYCSGGTQRCIGTSNFPLVQATATAATANWDFVVVLVNDTEHGGCAWGDITFNSTGAGFENIVLHELGHAIGDLADEYEEFSNTYAGGEPADVNLTTKTARADVKWRDLILATTPVPTWDKPDCSVFSAPPAAWNGIVGTYEGGGRMYTCGIYRPEPNCLMRSLGVNFCAVCRRQVQQVLQAFNTGPNLSITPWGYFQSPPVHPYWQTPDIWCDNNGNGTQDSDEPLINKADNHLFARITNSGSAPSPAFQVRFSYVPYTGVIDMANRQNITTVNRPALTNGLSDTVEVIWDLTAIPPAFAGVNHFCVIVEILTDECATYDNQAQNNFANVGTAGPAPAPVYFYIRNIYDREATGRIVIWPDPPPWRVEANVPDLNNIPLRAKEDKLILIKFIFPWITTAEKPLRPDARGVIAERQFDVTYVLEGQVLGGVSPRIVVRQREYKWGLSVHAGLTLPTGAFDQSYDGGTMVAVDLEYLIHSRLYAVLLAGLNRFKGGATGVDDTTWYNLSANLKYELRPSGLRPYINGGVGIYIPESGSSKFGGNIGLGFRRLIRPNLDGEIGVDLHQVFGEDVRFFTGHLGLILRF